VEVVEVMCRVLLCMLETVEGRFCFAGDAGGCALCETRRRHGDMETWRSGDLEAHFRHGDMKA
jgi:hypothetical protein